MTASDYKPESTLTTRLDSELLFKLKAVAWWRRSSQREVLEEGLQRVLNDMDPAELEKAVNAYRESQKND